MPFKRPKTQKRSIPLPIICMIVYLFFCLPMMAKISRPWNRSEDWRNEYLRNDFLTLEKFHVRANEGKLHIPKSWRKFEISNADAVFGWAFQQLTTRTDTWIAVKYQFRPTWSRLIVPPVKFPLSCSTKIQRNNPKPSILCFQRSDRVKSCNGIAIYVYSTNAFAIYMVSILICCW